MKKIMMVLTLCLVVSVSLSAESTAPVPFSKLEKTAAKQWGGWKGSKKVLAPLFNEERDRLGNSFQKELLTFVESDIERHYWAVSFLTDNDYLAGRKPMKEVALLLCHQAIVLCSESGHQANQKLLPIHINAAILSQNLGLKKQAQAHKKAAAQLLAQDPDLRGSWPVTSQEEKKVYNSIP